MFSLVRSSSYGSVLKAKFNRNGKDVAIKVIPISECDTNDLTKEINILNPF